MNTRNGLAILMTATMMFGCQSRNEVVIAKEQEIAKAFGVEDGGERTIFDPPTTVSSGVNDFCLTIKERPHGDLDYRAKGVEPREKYFSDENGDGHVDIVESNHALPKSSN